MEQRSGKTVKQAQHPLMTSLKDSPDSPGGVMYQGTEGGPLVKPGKGMAPKGMLIDGPYGGKVKA